MTAPVIQDPASFADPSMAWRSFYAGNYAAAFGAAHGVDAVLENLATIMCGAVSRGFAGLEQAPFQMPMVPLYRAYALWCLDRSSEAADCLSNLQDTPLRDVAERFSDAITGPDIDILVVHAPNSGKALDYDAVPGFRILRVELGPERFGATMADVLAALPIDARPALAISLDAYGAFLPVGFHDAGIPTVMWGSDHDYFIATRHADYAGATVIIVNSADEQIEMDACYGARVTSFPGTETFRQTAAVDHPGSERELDILFTGRAFVPYMADKARFLSRIATFDDTNLHIEIIDGYLPQNKYAEAIAQSRLVPTFCRYQGGLESRAVEAVMAGVASLSPRPATCGGLLATDGRAFRTLSEDDPDGSLVELIAQSDQVPELRPDADGLFWLSPDHEARLLKFAYFQTLLAPAGIESTTVAGSATPVELRGYDEEEGVAVYTAIANSNLKAVEKSAAHYNNAASAAFYAAILVGSDQQMGMLALDGFSLGRREYPRHLALAFNYARVLWLFGQHAQSELVLTEIGEAGDDWSFDPRTDALLSHRTRALAMMFCYGEYYQSVARSLVKDDTHCGPARSIIVAAVQTYLGQADCDRGDSSMAAEHYRRATEHADISFPAWAGLARMLAVGGEQSAETYRAFMQATKLYPPLLIDLMPIGVTALEAMGRRDDALVIVGQWLRLASRTCDVDRQPKPVPAEALELAVTHRDQLGEWAFALDHLRAATAGETS